MFQFPIKLQVLFQVHFGPFYPKNPENRISLYIGCFGPKTLEQFFSKKSNCHFKLVDTVSSSQKLKKIPRTILTKNPTNLLMNKLAGGISKDSHSVGSICNLGRAQNLSLIAVLDIPLTVLHPDIFWAYCFLKDTEWLVQQ